MKYFPFIPFEPSCLSFYEVMSNSISFHLPYVNALWIMEKRSWMKKSEHLELVDSLQLALGIEP